MLLERSDLTEIEVESGGTGLILRKPVADAATGREWDGDLGSGDDGRRLPRVQPADRPPAIAIRDPRRDRRSRRR